jgi:hypothetical protein
MPGKGRFAAIARPRSGLDRSRLISRLWPVRGTAAVAVLMTTWLAPCGAAHAGVQRYVSPSGKDSGTCNSATAPCKTFAYALHPSRFSPGDTLNANAGTYPQTLALVGGKSFRQCTAAAPCRIQPWHPGDAPVISGCVNVGKMMHTTWDNVDVVWPSAGCGSSPHMVQLKGGTNWTWTNSEFSESRSLSNVIVTRGSDGTAPQNWKLTYNCIHDQLNAADSPKAHNLYIAEISGGSGGLVSRNIIFRATGGQNVKLGPGNPPGGPTGVTVSYNTIHDAVENGVMLSDNTRESAIAHNLIVLTGDRPSNAAIRAYNLQADATGNVVASNGWFSSRHDVHYYPDPVGTRFVVSSPNSYGDPQFDSTGSCGGFHPRNPLMQAFGRYAPVP